MILFHFFSEISLFYESSFLFSFFFFLVKAIWKLFNSQGNIWKNEGFPVLALYFAQWSSCVQFHSLSFCVHSLEIDDCIFQTYTRKMIFFFIWTNPYLIHIFSKILKIQWNKYLKLVYVRIYIYIICFWRLCRLLNDQKHHV